MDFAGMANRYSWEEKYEAAVLETDRSQIVARIVVAQTVLNERLREIQTDHRATQEEVQALITAMRGLQLLRSERV